MPTDTSIRENIIANLETVLGTISQSNSYRTSPALVSRELKHYEELSSDQFPALFVIGGDEIITDATNMEHINIQAVAPLNGISNFIASMVVSLSVSNLKSKSPNMNCFKLANKPFTSSFTASLFCSISLACSLSSSEKLNLFSSIIL